MIPEEIEIQTDTPKTPTPPVVPEELDIIPITGEPVGNMFLDMRAFENAQRIAKCLAQSNFVPDRYKGNVADCTVAVGLGMELGISPITLMRGIYLVHGRPELDGKLVIALLNVKGPYKGGVHFELNGEGDSRECTAWAERRDTGTKDSATVSVQMAKDQGWWNRPGSYWPKMTEQMLKYRSATFLARANCPEILYGMYTRDESVDMGMRAETKKPAAVNLTERLRA